MPTPTYNDQSVPFGSRTEVFSSAGTLVLEDINITATTKEIMRYDQIGQCNGFVLVFADPPKGTGVAQIPTTGAAIPHVGETFSDTLLGSATESYVISQVGVPIATGAVYKVNVSFVMTHLAAGGYIPSGTPAFRNT